MVSKSHVTKLFEQCKLHVAFSLGSRGYFFSYHTISTVLLHLKHFENGPVSGARIIGFKKPLKNEPATDDKSLWQIFNFKTANINSKFFYLII